MAHRGLEGTCRVSIFGAISIATDLEQAVLDTLEKWFQTYLIEFELQTGLIKKNTDATHYPLPKSWLKADQVDRAAADAMPSIVVVSPGLSGRNAPRQEGDGSFRVFFSIGIGVFVGANNRPDTMHLVRVYTAIVRTILLQHQGLGGFADGCQWLDESYDNNFPFTDDQSISAGQVVFEIEVAGIVNRYGGPAAVEPTSDMPGSSWPLAETVIATVERKA